MNLTRQHKRALLQLVLVLGLSCAVGGYSMYRMAFFDDWSFWVNVAIPLCVAIALPGMAYLKICEYRRTTSPGYLAGRREDKRG